MSDNNNIKNFTSSDIERYLKGKMSPKERHDLEKAALDDPFLAEAIEGYSNANANYHNDITELKTRLSQRIGGAESIPITRYSRLRFLRVAAAIILLAGAGWLLAQFGIIGKKKEIAKFEAPAKTETQNNKVVTTDSVTLNGNTGSTVNSETYFFSTTDSPTKAPQYLKVNPSANGLASSGERRDTTVVSGNYDRVSSAPATQDFAVTPKQANEGDTTIAFGGKTDKETNAGQIKGEVTVISKEGKNKDVPAVVADDQMKYRNAQVFKAPDEKKQPVNYFRGQVTDATNTGIPFANITTLQENSGTYTDANGNFILTSPDSTINVQVRSVGFENNNYQLRNAAPVNKIVLQEDQKNLEQVVINNTSTNRRESAGKPKFTLSQSEPVDGWDKYNSYVANNLNIPQDFKNTTRANDKNLVEVSFEVNKYGDPVNIKIERSLCNTCDKEAIRLIKEGPKWKKGANKKERTTVTISF